MYSTAASILQLKELGVTLSLAGALPFICKRHISKYVLCKSDPVLFIYSYTELHQLSMTDSAHKYVAKELRCPSQNFYSYSGHLTSITQDLVKDSTILIAGDTILGLG